MQEMNTIKKFIVERLSDRCRLIAEDKSDEQIDYIANEIKRVMFTFKDELSIEFIFETLSHLGYAPNLVYDDNGLWSVVTDGIQPTVTDDERLDGDIILWCDKERWFKSIRDAVSYYLYHIDD